MYYSRIVTSLPHSTADSDSCQTVPGLSEHSPTDFYSEWNAKKLRNTLPGWTKTRLIGRTLLEKTAVITWTGPRLRQLTWLDSKVKFKRNKLTDSHPQEWVLGEAVPALLEFTASTCTKPFINPWPRVVSKRDYKLRTLALLSRVAP